MVMPEAFSDELKRDLLERMVKTPPISLSYHKEENDAVHNSTER